jgi:hypothetical protein
MLEGLQIFSGYEDNHLRIGLVDLSGQAVIPAECEDVLHISTGDDLELVDLIAADREGNSVATELVSFERVLPELFELKQNYPNPFNPCTDISYSLPSGCHVTLDIYNLLGQKVRTLVNQSQEAGHYTVTWDGRDADNRTAASGVYFYRIKAGDFIESKKMVLMK